MEPIKFPEANSTLAKAQPQYHPLEVCKLSVEGMPGVFSWTCKYKLSEIEIKQIMETGSIYFTQRGDCFHPISPRIESPFLSIEVLYKEVYPHYYKAWVKNNAGEVDEFGTCSAREIIYRIIQKYNDIDDASMLRFKEKPSMYIGEKGLEEE